MAQRGQIFPLESTRGAAASWAYRYRAGGRGSHRVQRGGFPSRLAAEQALERALQRLRQEHGLVETPTLAEFVEVYLAQHDTEPETIAKLRWLLTKATTAFGDRPITELMPAEIAAWRMSVPYGHRFEATQALRQTLQRAVIWGMLNSNPAKQGVENRQRPRVEQRRSSPGSRSDCSRIGSAPATGRSSCWRPPPWPRPSEWLALEHRDIDREARIAYVRRAYRSGRLKCPKIDGSMRAVPFQVIALEAIDRLPVTTGSALLFPAMRGGYLDLHNFRHRDWKPAQRTLAIDPIRRVYDLRHTFATFAPRAGISTFDLSRHMGASLTMIDRHYGHLAKDGREHAITLLDAHTRNNVHAMDATWTRKKDSPSAAAPGTSR